MAARTQATLSWRWLFVLAWFHLALCQNYAAPSFTTTLDRNVVPVGETVTLSLIFEGATPAGAPALPALPNLRVSPGVNQSSQFSFVNGQQTARQTYSYTLIAQQVGNVVIPGMQAQAGGTMLTSQPLSLKIVPAAAGNANAGNPLTNLAFLRLIVPKAEVYVGEPFPVEMHLYWQNADGIRMPQLNAEGFSLGQMPKPTQTRTQVGNMVYHLAIFKLTASAARSGALTLGPVEQNLTIQVPVNNPRRRNDPFEAFFGGQQVQQYPTTLKSEVISMRVLPLPAQNKPADFNGAIGSYQMSVTAGPTNLGVGDPITVRVRISGRGPIDSLNFPSQTQWRDFNTYAPSSTVETSDDLGLVGAKSFEQVIIPQNHEIKTLPPVRFSFFDPNAKSYRTLTGPTFPLNVRPSATASAPPPSLTNSASGATPPVDDIIHIKPHLEITAAAPLLILRPWFMVLQGVPVLLWLALLTWRKRNESLANNPRLRRQREVAQRIREGLKELRGHAEARKSEEFFATLFRLLQEQLGERLDLPATAITEAVIDERLRAHSLAQETLKAIHELFQTCNVARYAPIQSSQELAALIPKLEGVLRDLQQLKA